jgi:hypothetical protein
MIFCSRNEAGVIKADWIASLPVGTRFVTRRGVNLNADASKTFAVCPNRGKFQVCRAKVISWQPHSYWQSQFYGRNEFGWNPLMQKEAELEGFKTVEGWLAWYPAHKIDINETFRIEMERI